MFRLTPWSHGIWFSTDKNIQRSQETGPNFHFLSEKLIESESREKVSFKTSSPQGSPFCPTFPLLLCPRTPPCWNYSSNFHWSKDTSFQLGLSTTQPLWLALRTGWFLVEIRPCCSFSYPDLDEQSWHLHQLSFSEHLRKIALPPFWSVRTLELTKLLHAFLRCVSKVVCCPSSCLHHQHTANLFGIYSSQFLQHILTQVGDCTPCIRFDSPVQFSYTSQVAQ